MIDHEKLEQLAKDRLVQLPPNHPSVVAEFAGSPKAGKSTAIDILSHFFKRMGYKVWAPTEGASKRTPYHLKRDLVAFNTWTLNYAISEIVVAYYNVEHHNLILLDRGPHDSLAWMSVLRAQRKLDDDEYQTITNYALNTRWSQLISRVFLFSCPVETSLMREHESKLTRQPGTAMNKQMLALLLDEYNRFGRQIDESRLRRVETSSQTTPIQTAYELALDLLAEFEQHAMGNRRSA